MGWPRLVEADSECHEGEAPPLATAGMYNGCRDAGGVCNCRFSGIRQHAEMRGVLAIVDFLA